MSNSGSDSDCYIPPNDQVSPQAFQMTVGEWHLDAHKEAVVLARDSQKFEALHDQHIGELERLFGTQKYRQFRRYVAKEDERVVQELKFPKGPELSDEAKKTLLDRRRTKIDAYLKRLGIDEAAIKKISARYRKRFARADQGGVPAGVEVQEPLPISKVPMAVRLGKTNPWTLVEPPFDGWS